MVFQGVRPGGPAGGVDNDQRVRKMWQWFRLPAGGGAITSIATPLTLTAGVLDIQAATPSLEGSMSAADKTKLDAIASGAQVNVLEGVTGTAPIVAGAIAAKSQAISIVAATASVPGSMSAADKAKLDAQSVITSVATPLTLAGGALDIQQASASLEGSMSAANFAKLATLAPPILQLDLNVNWDYFGGTAFGAASFNDIDMFRNIAVTSANSYLIIVVQFSMLFNLTSAGIAQVACFLNINNNTRFELVSATGGNQSPLWLTATGATLVISGIGGGGTNIKFQFQPSVNVTGYLRAASFPRTEFFRYRVIEINP